MQKETKMKRNKLIMAGFILIMVLALVAGCKSAPAPQTSGGTASAAANPMVGTWEATESDGTIYIFDFKADTWELHLETSGITAPMFRGTYTMNGTRVNMQIVDEGDMSTMGWMKIREAMPPFAGRLNGDVFTWPLFENLTFRKD